MADPKSQIPNPKLGFTLVELLVVVTIIAVLVALLLPALQAAREAARQTQCKNNLKQLALGCLSHEQAQGFFPAGGWGWGWSGDPQRGNDRRQPGGWIYNLLPFIEQQPLHDLGSSGSTDQCLVARGQTAQTPLRVVNCPARRLAVLYPYIHPSPRYCNLDPSLTMVARSDYAGNGGEILADVDCWYGPQSLTEGDAMTELAWSQLRNGGAAFATGVFWLRSMCKMTDIPDGTSNTYLCGEKYIGPDWYSTGVSAGDDQGWTLGYDWDVNRMVNNDPAFLPRQDQPGFDNAVNFGSVHANGFQMAFCDGSVQMISYSIDLEAHRRLGNRKDGKTIDAKAF